MKYRKVWTTVCVVCAACFAVLLSCGGLVRQYAFFTWKPFDLDGDALFVFLPNLEGSVCTGSATSHVGCEGVLWDHVLVDSGFA